MKIGDLVKCMTVDGQPVGLVVERFTAAHSRLDRPKLRPDIFYVLIPGYEDSFPIRTSQMEKINVS